VTHEAVLEVLTNNNERLKNLLFRMVEVLPAKAECKCQNPG
jgi:hypothetical protein